MAKRIIINVANLHIGGGIQVASSFIDELNLLLRENKIKKEFKFSVVFSNEVINSLSKETNLDYFDFYTVHDVWGMKKPDNAFFSYFDGHDLAFTIFGPVYHKLPVKKHICGFAQAWIAYPHNLAFKHLSFIPRLKAKLKFELQWHYFKRESHLIVEQEHVKNALVANRAFNSKKITVVENCVSSRYITESNVCYKPVDIKKDITIGIMGRAYSHKNIDILPAVSSILLDSYGLNVQFTFTLTSGEMKELRFDSIHNFKTVGSLPVEQCVDFYREVDIVLFPSLLECYSATPVEAMAMKVPVFASDLDFVKDVCSDFAFYFDPQDPASIAKVIFDGLSNSHLLEYNVDNAYLHVRSLPTAKDRAEQYVKLLTN